MNPATGETDLFTLNTGADLTWDAGLARAADLSVTAGDEPARQDEGGESYTFVVRNKGPADATGVTLTMDLSPAVTIEPAAPRDQRCSQLDDVVTCDIGIFETGAETTIAVVVARDSEQGTIGAHVSADQPGLVDSDNSVVVTTRIPSFGSIHGQVFHDQNANGARDPGEPGLNGWVVERRETLDLLNILPLLLDTTTTISTDLDNDGVIDPITEQGLFRFTDIPTDSYVIHEVQQAGWGQTTPVGEAPGSGIYSVTVASGQIVENVDFGNVGPALI